MECRFAACPAFLQCCAPPYRRAPPRHEDIEEVSSGWGDGTRLRRIAASCTWEREVGRGEQDSQAGMRTGGDTSRGEACGRLRLFAFPENRHWDVRALRVTHSIGAEANHRATRGTESESGDGLRVARRGLREIAASCTGRGWDGPPPLGFPSTGPGGAGPLGQSESL
jgi:hypothetical protein